MKTSPTILALLGVTTIAFSKKISCPGPALVLSSNDNLDSAILDRAFKNREKLEEVIDKIEAITEQVAGRVGDTEGDNNQGAQEGDGSGEGGATGGGSTEGENTGSGNN